MNLGVKGWMGWLQGVLNTTNKGLALQNGITWLFLMFRPNNSISCFGFCFSNAWVTNIFRRTVVSIPYGPSALAVKEAAWGLARYAAISQVYS